MYDDDRVFRWVVAVTVALGLWLCVLSLGGCGPHRCSVLAVEVSRSTGAVTLKCDGEPVAHAPVLRDERRCPP